MLSDYLNKVEEKINNLVDRHKKYSDKGYLIAFRGENKDYGKTKLMPSLFRDKAYIGKERYLFELLGDYGFLDGIKERNIEKAMEAQHYIAISRMLDITFSLLPAFYFACATSCEDDENSDAIVYIFCFPEQYSPHSQYIEQFYTDILEDSMEDITYSSNFKVISHSYSNERIKAQVGGFIFFPGKEYRAIPDVYYDVIWIQKSDKKTLLKELDRIFNINEATLFPEKEKLGPIIKQKFKEQEYVKRTITLRSEVEAFFDRIDYELAMAQEKINEGDNSLLRYLRKEKSDLLAYVTFNYRKNLIDQEEYKELGCCINSSFQFLALKYRR